ncbi:MAG: TonB-dependent receptor, partial [Sphingobacteriales bacterium]
SAVVTSDAGNGVGYTGLRIRGTDVARTNVTLNGIPVNDAESQGTFFVNFSDLASSTSSIQLQRGVGTSTNGAGAFGATMSISNLQQFEEAGAEIDNTYGSFNTHKHTIKAGTGLLKSGLQFDVRLSKINSDGFVDRSSSDLRALQFIAGWRVSDKTHLRFMMMTGSEKTAQAWNGIPEAKLKGDNTALLNHYNNNIGTLYFTPADSVNLFTANQRKYNYFTYKDQTDNYQQDYYQLFADHKFGKYLTGNVGLFLTRGRGFYNEYKTGESFSSYGLNDYVSPSGTDTVTNTDLTRQLWLDNYYYGGVFSLLYEKNKTQLALGGGYTEYDGNHYGYVKWAQIGIPVDYRWYLLDSRKNDLNIYAKAQQTLGDNLILFADVQYRNVDYRMNGFRKNPTLTPEAKFNFFNPKIGITYLIRNTNNQKQRLYGSVALANKEPNRDDFEASPLNQPKAERLSDIEAGYEINKRNWSASANGFYMMYRDQLVATGKINGVGSYTRTNVPESYRRGIELQAAYMPAYWVRINANATFSQNKIGNFVEYVDNYDDPNGNQSAIDHGTTDIAFSPNTVAAGGLTFTPFRNLPYKQNLELGIMGKYVGKQYLDNTANDARSIDAYSLCDVRIRYSVQAKPFKELAFTLALNNILNKQYESNGYTYSYIAGGSTITENFYFPQAGFNWMAGLNLKF